MPNLVMLAQLKLVERSKELKFGTIKKEPEEEDDTFPGSKKAHFKQ